MIDENMNGWSIGIIGGSGLYDIAGLEDIERRTVDTPWGAPSDEIVTGRLGHIRIAFLPRHGRGHRISPSEINARANVDALKRLGVTDVLAISSVGSLVEERPPGSFTMADQFIDRTQGRASSFFGSGCVAHVSMADPVCPRLAGFAAEAARDVGAAVSEGGTCIVMEGPQFSSRAESRLYRQWGAHIIGMTAYPEAKLCREAELPYALVGMVTDYDCWREEEAGVDVSEVIARMHDNSAKARAMVELLAKALPEVREASPIDTCLDNAILTGAGKRDPALVAKLDAVAGRAFRLHAA